MSRPSVTLVGQPFEPIGTSRVLRSTFDSLSAVGLQPKVRNTWGRPRAEESAHAGIDARLDDSYSEINVFHLNTDEVDRAFEHLGDPPRTAQNILYPMWELETLPDTLANHLEPFDEIWAISRFTAEALSSASTKPVFHLPCSAELELASFLGRRYFGIPEAAYAFLFVFDCRSFLTRKNPAAVVAAFRQVLDARPWAKVTLVIKLHGRQHALPEANAFIESLETLGDRAVLLDRLMSENELANLMRCCDAFVSLHRSEGFGLALAESMYLGIPVVGTAYSGNMDYMNGDNARLVSYQPVDVPEGAYPGGLGQRWAEPDVDEAANHMIALLDDPAEGRALGHRGSRTIRIGYSRRAAGLRYLARLQHLASGSAGAAW